jgi:hypothetical protein
VYQTQHSVEASRQPSSSTFELMVSIVTWGIIFSSLLIFLQAGLNYVFKTNYTLISRNGLLLLVSAVLELMCSFFAALVVSSRTGRIWTGILAGVLVRVLSGMADLYLTVAAWHAVLARLHTSLALEGQARQAIGRSLIELLISLLLSLGIASLGALVADRLANRSSTTYQPYSPMSSGGSLSPALEPHTAGEFPRTPTPNGWRFGPYDYSQSGKSNPDIELNQWRYSQRSYPPPSPPPPPTAQQIGGYQPPIYPSSTGDAPTRLDAGNTPTELLQPLEDTSLPLPYPGREDIRHTPN